MTIVAAIAVVKAKASAINAKIILIACSQKVGLSAVTLEAAHYVIVNSGSH
jgi:hypothetical protein